MNAEIIHNDYPLLEGIPSNFYEHRKTALRWIQMLSGNVWTDYNVHDPGVTIIEVLSYALTEIEYKIDFPIEDILLSSTLKNSFDLKKNAFFLAEDIMTCAPVTQNDYRKLIINAIPHINNAWLKYDELSKAYKVLLLKKKEVELPETITAVEKLLGKFRAIGSPPLKIEVASFMYISLGAEIYLTSDVEPENVLAEVFYNLNESYLNVTPHRQTFTELEAQGMHYNEIFDGPKMQNGIVTNAHLFDLQDKIDYVDIKEIIAGTSGVKMVDNLQVQEQYDPELSDGDIEKQQIDKATLDAFEQNNSFIVPEGYVPYFSPKHKYISNNIKLFKNGKRIEFNASKVHERIGYLTRRAKRNYTLKDHKAVTHKISGRQRQVNKYYSIKNDFPNAYGLKKNGFSFIQNLDLKYTRQLKDYLLPFEQIIANSFKRLSNLWAFFSTNSLKEELLHEPLMLEHELIKNGQTNNYEESNAAIAIPIRKVKEFKYQQLEKRDKILTHMLARFDVHLRDEFEMRIMKNKEFEAVIKSKEQLLQKIEKLLANRNIFNRDDFEGLTSLETELYLHLGIYEQPKRPYYRAVSGFLEIVDGVALNRDYYKNESFEKSPVQNYVFEQDTSGNFVKRKNILHEILKLGVNKSSYEIVKSESKSRYHIALKSEDDSFKISLGRKKTKAAAQNYIKDFVSTFSELSKNSEGFYAVDHAMFYNAEDPKSWDVNIFHMSFIFPNWSPRFQDPSYQREVKQIVRKLIPAHVHAECYWLDLSAMTQFEIAYANYFEGENSLKATSKNQLQKIIDDLRTPHK